MYHHRNLGSHDRFMSSRAFESINGSNNQGSGCSTCIKTVDVTFTTRIPMRLSEEDDSCGVNAPKLHWSPQSLQQKQTLPFQPHKWGLSGWLHCPGDRRFGKPAAPSSISGSGQAMDWPVKPRKFFCTATESKQDGHATKGSLGVPGALSRAPAPVLRMEEMCWRVLEMEQGGTEWPCLTAHLQGEARRGWEKDEGKANKLVVRCHPPPPHCRKLMETGRVQVGSISIMEAPRHLHCPLG